MPDTEERLRRLEEHARRTRLVWIVGIAFAVLWFVLPGALYVLKRYLYPGTPTSILLLYLLPFVAVVAGILVVYWRRTRRRFDTCQQCGYNLTGNISGVCPECGTAMAS